MKPLHRLLSLIVPLWKRQQLVAWGASGLLHVLLLAAMIVVRARVEPVELAIRSGGVTIVAMMEPAKETQQDAPWHLHAPAVPNDHDHEHHHAADVVWHRHEREPLPAAADLTRQAPAVELTVRPLPAVEVVSRLMPSRSPATVSRPEAELQPPPTDAPRSQRPARTNRSAGGPPPVEAVSVPAAASATDDQAGATVDELPHKLATNPAPQYPREAYVRGQQGRVLLEVQVGAAGQVLAVRVFETSGVPLLDQAALDAVRGWRFRPARRAGRAVPFTVTVPVRFSIRP
ncbi:MAG: energy transducer TonB [Pirellulaceae bacterium]|nr:energy transducer TonB [Pirellulaceae bacterium]